MSKMQNASISFLFHFPHLLCILPEAFYIENVISYETKSHLRYTGD